MKPPGALILASILVLALGCTSYTVTMVKVTREIELPPGTAFAVGAGEGDAVELSVTVPEGHAHAGTYTSASPHLVTPLRDAMEMMGKPGAKTVIVVDEKNVIQSVTNEVTKQ